MRVGVSLLHLGNWSGTGFYTEQLLQALLLLEKQGVHPVGLTPTGTDPRADLDTHPVPSVRLRWPFRFGAELVSGCRGLNLDLIHYPSGVGPPRLDIPIVATIHDVSPFLQKESLLPHKAAYLRMAFTSVSRVAKVILADSHWQAERIVETLGLSMQKVHVLPPCVPSLFSPETDSMQTSSNQERPFFLAVGTLEPRKNIPRLVDAWRRLQAPHDLVVVGRWGWMYETLRTRLDMLGQHRLDTDGTEIWELHDGRRILRKEHLPASELAKLYRSAEALVYPSLFEGFGLPVLEAMSCGCPVLTSWRSPMEEIAGKAGWYFDPEDEDSILTTLQDFLKDPEERAKRVQMGLERAQRFTLPFFSEQLYEVYQRVLGRELAPSIDPQAFSPLDWHPSMEELMTQTVIMESSQDDVALVRDLKEKTGRLKAEIAKAIVGQEAIVENLLICLLSGGHCLLIGVPGLAKTMLVRTFSEALRIAFKRIQFTPDLMPSDITGTEIIEEDQTSGRRSYRYVKGPIFANVVLADEINRTPPKTQAALLEAMQEYQVTAAGEDHPLPLPFFVLATQNPIEQEGTYPLPEAQLDRFMFSLLVEYPSVHEEIEIVKRNTSAFTPEIQPVLSSEEVIDLQRLVRRVPVSEDLVEFAVQLATSSRPAGNQIEDLNEFIRKYVAWGAGPRASFYLILAAKARAILHGRYAVSKEDILTIASPVLRHRIVPTFRAEADGIGPEGIVEKVIESVVSGHH